MKWVNKGRTCRQDGCQSPASGKGLCATHYARDRKGQDLSAPIRTKLPAAICQHPPCDRPAQNAGWCGAHYQRIRNGRDMDAPILTKRQNEGRTCRYEGCGLPAVTSGYCNAHYLRDRRGQPMDAPIRKFAKRQVGPCPWPGCDRKIATAGLCQIHYRRKIEGRAMDAPIRAPRKIGEGEDRVETKEGYVMVKRPGHFGKPLGHRKEWFYEHRYVMEKYLERPLHEGETVHHLNGDRKDNRLENLEPWATIQQPAGQRVIDLLNWAYAVRAGNGVADDFENAVPDLLKRAYEVRERYQHERHKHVRKQTTTAPEEDAP